jgi:hypothetical protein
MVASAAIHISMIKPISFAMNFIDSTALGVEQDRSDQVLGKFGIDGYYVSFGLSSRISDNSGGNFVVLEVNSSLLDSFYGY